MDIKELINSFEELTKYARIGMLHKERMEEKDKAHDLRINKLKNELENLRQICIKRYEEIIHLKKTHPDWEGITCPDCNGAGGFTWETEFGCEGEACHCDNGIHYIKKNKGE